MVFNSRSRATRWLRPAFAAVLASLLLSLAAAPAVAAQSAVKADPDDTSGVLDLSGIGMQRKNNGNVFVGVRTFAPLDAAELDAAGDNRIVFSFNVDGDNHVEYVGTISTVDGKMQMVLKGDAGPSDPIPVVRIDARTIKVKLVKGSPANVDGMRVFVKSRLTGAGACADTCVDRAPDTGSLSF
jgi:hypothetical protein